MCVGMQVEVKSQCQVSFKIMCLFYFFEVGSLTKTRTH